jgi:ribosomal protein L37AE/L43A
MGGRTRGDFPRTIAEFHRRFPDDETCLQCLVETCWPDGFRCPGCGSPNARLLATCRVWQCRACRRQTSATAGTVLHRTRQAAPPTPIERILSPLADGATNRRRGRATGVTSARFSVDIIERPALDGVIADPGD